ncbi:MAG TPA: bifunctional alpha,alpha-trehalose-phosphate synthase (UDP-forming)/trehalose-phosphatase [Gemmatimonadales bacterium]|nr:bifunctional alpha,alpha-trehalose-phosphate synthase (UDP-forming)/trehalose-phosphatase [Gemmatimonadales bacterium]
MSRILIAANRLPLTAERGPDGIVLRPSAGGLATGLAGVHGARSSLWFGWSGLADDGGMGEEPSGEEWARHGCVPIPLSVAEVDAFYQDYCNAVIWPLFHCELGRLPLYPGPWSMYERINERYADALRGELAPDDIVWVHDYQLMRVPVLLRRRMPHARIGFFLHIPFPPAEVYGALPDRALVLEGLLGADLIGFHTHAYLENFEAAVERFLGIASEGGQITFGGRTVRLGVYPMGVDVARFAGYAENADVERMSRGFLGEPGTKLLLGVDRLDYTKGIPRRLLAFERMLQLHPELEGSVRLIQLAVPTRSQVPAYRRFREHIDGLVGRINGSFGTPTWTPVHYLVRSLGEAELAALYRASDVMLVTPVRDGMNLVAKEFVASRGDGDGVLVLSEFAGAAAELGDALLVNPYDLEGTARAMHRALTMPEGERRARMEALRRAVQKSDVRAWADAFLTDIVGAAGPGCGATRERGRSSLSLPAPHVVDLVLARARAASHVRLLLDYDGTMVPFAPTPEGAAPDPELLAILAALAARPRTVVHVVSGRDRRSLGAWLGELPVELHAEHGLWRRGRDSRQWRREVAATLPLRDEILTLFESAAARVPGALVEEKSVGLAWHYRRADPRTAAAALRWLRTRLRRLVPGGSIDLLSGDRVLEVRPVGVDKGGVGRRVLTEVPPGGLVIAMGDDQTDEQLFSTLGGEALTICVGHGPTAARMRVQSVHDARTLLAELAADFDPGGVDAPPPDDSAPASAPALPGS